MSDVMNKAAKRSVLKRSEARANSKCRRTRANKLRKLKRHTIKHPGDTVAEAAYQKYDRSYASGGRLVF